MSRELAIIDLLDTIPDAILAARLDAVREQLRRTRPGRRSRLIFALAIPAAISDAAEVKQAFGAVAMAPLPNPMFLRRGAPHADTQARINRSTTKRAAR